MPENIITGLDIGSSHIRVVVGQKDNPEEPLRIIGAAEVPSAGISKGVIMSIDDATSAITACLQKAERMVGAPLEEAFVGIAGPNILSQSSRGVVAVSKVDGEIREEDVTRAIDAARTVVSPPNYEILHVLPRTFTVDGQSGIKDPVGMMGVRLEVDTHIIHGLTSHIKNLTKCVYKTGLDINDLVFSILACSEAILVPRQKELGVGVMNIGRATTSIVVYEEGDVMHTAVLPIGSDHITSDIAIGLRISIDAAEKIKIEHGSCLSKDIQKHEVLQLETIDPNEQGEVSLKYIAEIIEARVEEIFEKVDAELKKIDRSGLLPSGMVLTGGGAKLQGIIDIAKKKLRLPASLGKHKDIMTAIEKINDLAYTTAIGLVLWGSQSTAQTGKNPWTTGKHGQAIQHTISKIKGILNSFKT